MENMITLKNGKTMTVEQLKRIQELDHIHITWKDYALMLLNSTAEPLRSIWHEKVLTSVHHWNVKDGSISEANVFGLELLSELPRGLTELVVDDWYEPDGEFSWHKMGRLSGSKRMKLHIGNYPQESLSNEAWLCVQWVFKHMNEPLPEGWVEDVIRKNGNREEVEAYMDLAKQAGAERVGCLLGIVPSLRRLVRLAVAMNGKSITQDEVLTYILECPLPDTKHGAWMLAAVDVAVNGIPSDKWEEYWKTGKVEGFPLNCEDYVTADPVVEEGLRVAADRGKPMDERWDALCRFLDRWECNVSTEEMYKLVEQFCTTGLLREDVSYSPCWKKICICVLKNDTQFKYAGFGATLRERQVREQAIAAFETKQEEKAAAKANAAKLAKEIEERNAENAEG